MEAKQDLTTSIQSPLWPSDLKLDMNGPEIQRTPLLASLASTGALGQDDRVMNPRYKTEICRNFKERSKCVYGDKCQFAHGRRELRDVVRNSKYKTKLCQKYWLVGYCAYGPRCNFLHDEMTNEELDELGINAMEIEQPKLVSPTRPSRPTTPTDLLAINDYIEEKQDEPSMELNLPDLSDFLF